DLDLEKTIKESFNIFLNYNHYNSEIDFFFTENTYGDIYIRTITPLTSNIKIEIEENALLELDNKDTISFKYYEDDFSEEDLIEENSFIEEKDEFPNTRYSSKVNILG
ncbi:unnamed protein product, partial [marine sediment metagenome]